MQSLHPESPVSQAGGLICYGFWIVLSLIWDTHSYYELTTCSGLLGKRTPEERLERLSQRWLMMKLESTGICEPKPSLTEEDAPGPGRSSWLKVTGDSSALMGKNLTLRE